MKVAFITGTRKGIGNYLANHLLNHGWKVAGCSRRTGTIDHPHYRHFELDITQEAEVIAAIRHVKREVGQIDTLLNNAGTASMNHLLLSPESSYRQVFDTNVLGSFLVLRECAKQMRRNKTGGRIINFSSIAAPLNLEGEALYAASKSAVESLTRTAARELAEFNITVNAIGPTPIRTDLIRQVPEEKIQSLLKQQALPRFGTYEDVANCVDFFLRDQSNFITGQTLYLGGVS